MTPSMRRTILITCLALPIVAPSAAHAYLDPGSGSYILQILVAGLVAASFVVRAFWTNLKGFVAHVFGRRGSPSSGHD